MKVLVTGGAGFIGGTIVAACADAGITTVVLDDMSTGHPGFELADALYRGDIADGAVIDRIVAEHPDIHAVVHCAARIVVPESVADPLGYYDSNVGRTISMLHNLVRHGIDRVVFSSSASVYLAEAGDGVNEDAPLAPGNPYARTKAMVETILEDGARAGQLRSIVLRYFNPIGADPAMRTGLRNPAPSHVLGKLMQAARDGQAFTLTGDDWPTRDGSGVRDFIHVWDLAQAHVQALTEFDRIAPTTAPFLVLNVGGGTGTTVRELVAAFEEVTAESVDLVVGPRRPGDSAGAYAVVDRAAELLHWRARLTVADGIRDSLTWSQRTVEDQLN